MGINKNNKIVTRFAPSPTGFLHVGSARTALFNYLFTKQNNGEMILRLEDTDESRSKKEFEKDILEGMKWLGLNWDNKELYRQSERKDIYKKYIKKLLDEDKAYSITEEKENDDGEKIESTVIRFRNPGTKIKFDDLVRGEIEFDTTDLGDFVIAKKEDSPLYHLAVVIDDFEMGITHVIRGEDGISNTPRQILIQEAIGAPRPIYAHIPLILGSDKSKLSKRHGAVSVIEYRKQGYIPEAMINFMAFIGWNPGDERELFTMDELLKDFSIEKIQKGGAVFNIEKLNWINKQYIKNKDEKELAKEVLEYLPKELKKKIEKNSELWEKVVALEKERIEKLPEIGENVDFFFEQPEYDKEMLLWKKEPSLEKTAGHLQEVINLLKTINEKEFVSHNIKETILDYAEREGKGNVLWPWRVALTGLERSPDPFSVSEVLSKDEVIKRLDFAINKIVLSTKTLEK